MSGAIAVRFLAFNPVLLVTSGLSRSDNPKWTNAVLIGAGNEELQPVTSHDAQHLLEF
jgi:hypothetical protein